MNPQNRKNPKRLKMTTKAARVNLIKRAKRPLRSMKHIIALQTLTLA
jgi:hypothetical protein